jgi:hypothetical protein
MELGEFNACSHHSEGSRHLHQRIDQVRPINHHGAGMHFRNRQVGGEDHIAALRQTLAEAVVKVIAGFQVVSPRR